MHVWTLHCAIGSRCRYDGRAAPGWVGGGRAGGSGGVATWRLGSSGGRGGAEGLQVRAERRWEGHQGKGCGRCSQGRGGQV